MTPTNSWIGRHNIPPESAFPLHLPMPVFLTSLAVLALFSAWFIWRFIRVRKRGGNY